MTTPLIVIKNLSKTFALENISSEIPRGQIVGIVGPDGAGKTTLLRLLAALLHPSEGHIEICGFDTVKEAKKVREVCGYMPQKFGLYEDLTVIQNLHLYADLRGLARREKQPVFESLLKFTALASFTERLAGHLSGGMKQKLGLACALLKKPPLILLDEPSVGVDPISRRELWKMVYSLIDEGISVIWSTAYLDEAAKCHRVLLLNEGKLLYEGPPKDLTARVVGRVFKLTQIQGSPRKKLMEVQMRKEVVDATIQGGDLRLVMRGKELPSFDSPLVPIEPRFEDAFIDILGGASFEKSKLAERREATFQGNEVLVVAKDLVKMFGSFTAVNQISFEVKRGEIFGLLGPNGAGKTTTFKMLCGLTHPTSGRTEVAGKDLEQAPGEARSKIGYMAQKFSLYGNLSVKQNLSFFAGAYNLTKDKQQAIREMEEIFDLTKYMDVNADDLPLGYKRRLSIACANMHNPPILFLDEPTSGVDPITRREFWNHINALVEKGVSVLVTTHFMDEAEYCDRIALIYQGSIIQMDTPDALKMRAKSENNPSPTLEDAFIQLIEAHEQPKT